MKPTEVLTTEHDAIKRMLQILGCVCDHLEAGEEVDSQHLEQIVEFIRVFTDRCHHGKEEDLLFPAMEAAGVPNEGGPIGVMLREHDLGRTHVKGMSEAVAQYKAGVHNVTSAIVQNARNYIALLDQHIVKENDILYPIANMHLSPKEQASLLEGFERVERERIGPGKHEEFHQLLEHLESIYPNSEG